VAWPAGYHTFFMAAIPPRPHSMEWSTNAVVQLEPYFGAMIVSGYMESNDTITLAGHGFTDCDHPCAVTSFPTIDAILNTTVGWGALLPKEKLVVGVGWYGREWSLHKFPAVRDPLGARISFCQAVALSKSAAHPPVFDKGSASFHFTCNHDPGNSSTWQGCVWPRSSTMRRYR